MMRMGRNVFSALVLLSAHFQAADATNNVTSTKALEVPAEPKLPVPWKQLASNLEAHKVIPHQKKKVPSVHNHSNKSHSVQPAASVHPKEDQAKFVSDTEGVVVEAVPKDVATKMDMKLKAAEVAPPAPKEVPPSHSPSLPSNSTTDVMAALHHEAELKLHKGEKKHTLKKAAHNATHNSTNHPKKHLEQPKQKNGLASFEKDMGVNASAPSHPTNNTETPAKVVTPIKKEHKGKHHKPKKVFNMTLANVTGGDVMTMLHHEIAEEDAPKTVKKEAPAHTTTTSTTTTTTTHPKGLFHLKEDMYLGGHQDKAAVKPAPHVAPVVPAASASSAVHSAISVSSKKHHKDKYAGVVYKPKPVMPKDPMAAVHKEAETIEAQTSPKPQEKPAPTQKPSSAPLKVEPKKENSAGLARLDAVLGTNQTVKAVEGHRESAKPEGSTQPKKHFGLKKHKMRKASEAAKSAKPVDTVDPISALHHELHPHEATAPKPVEKPALKVVTSPAKQHESRRNSLRKLRDDENR